MSHNTWTAATLLWEPQIWYPGSWSCTALYSVNTNLSVFKSTATTSIHKQNVCCSYCRQVYIYVPATLTQMISRILHSSLLCEIQHLTLQFTYMVPGSIKISHAHLHVWDILASLNAQKYLFEVIHTMHYNHISYFFNQPFNE